MVLGRHSAILGVLAESLSGPQATRRVAIVAAGLGLLGLLLLIATVWWWRSTRAEHPSLGPLEVMSARRWRRSGDAEQSRLIEKVRPSGSDRAPGFVPEPVDLSVLAAVDHAGFDDLREIDLMLGLQLPGSLALGTEPSAVDRAAIDGSDVDDDAVEAVDVPIDLAADDTALPAAGDESERVDDVDDEDDADDADADDTAAIDGGDVAALLVREAVDEHERHARRGELRAGLERLGDLSVAEAHDLERVTDSDDDDDVEVDEDLDVHADGDGRDGDQDTIDPLLQRAANPD